MIRKCLDSDFEDMLSIINDAATAYKGVIPAQCWHEPYMSGEQLKKDIESGIEFYGYEDGGKLAGVMGIQYFPDVTLIRHAYVLTSMQGKGIGGELLTYLVTKTNKPILIGTWRDTEWSIRFYEKHGFRVLEKNEIDKLLKKYWKISEIHRKTSVVLADKNWPAK